MIKFIKMRFGKAEAEPEQVGDNEIDQYLEALEKEAGEAWLRHKGNGQFLLALLKVDRSAQETGRIINILKKWYGRKRETGVPEDTTGNPNKVAEDLLRIIVLAMMSKTGKCLADRKTRSRVSIYLYENWAYRKDAVRRMLKSLKGQGKSTSEIISQVKVWVKDSESAIEGSDGKKLQEKIWALLSEFRQYVRKNEACHNRLGVINALLNYSEWDSARARTCSIKSTWGADRLTTITLNFDNGKQCGLSGMRKVSDEFGELSKWKCDKTANGIAFRITPCVAPGINLSMVQNESGDKALKLVAGNEGIDWVIYKHRKEDRFVILNLKADAVLVNRDGLELLDVTMLSEDVELACWIVEQE